MSDNLAAVLDLNLAWKRVKLDAESGRLFVKNPNELELVSNDLAGWLDQIGEKIRDGYSPSAAMIADIPKSGGAVRPGALLTLEDRVVYTSCVGSALPVIYPALEWSQGVVDFAYQLERDHSSTKWLKSAFGGWGSFRKSSLEKIRGGLSNVLITDITGFYENIDIATLISDLRQVGLDPEIVNLLSTCLNRWAGIPRGIPQGTSASDILAKLYLNPVDMGLRDAGFAHLRYVDDMRIFCASEQQCKLALMNLIRLLRRRGLNLQTAKTEMLPASDAREKIEAIAPVVQRAKDDFIRKIVDQIQYQGDYLTMIDADRIAAEHTTDHIDEAPISIFYGLFDEYFKSNTMKFNPTMFHFLLNRMRAVEDGCCQEYCLAALSVHPEETANILSYLGAVGNEEETLRSLEEYLSSADSIYDYQIFQIFEWIGQRNERITERLRSIARAIAFDNSRPAYLRAACRMVLGVGALFSDLERIEMSYASAADPLERAQILLALSEIKAGRRNTFMSRARGDGWMCKAAEKVVRGN